MNGSPFVRVDLTERYTIERELGRGVTATVYLARDRTTGRRVAVKMLRPELAQSMGADRFLREIRLIAQLQHPNIVPLLDSGERDGMFAYVLPYMDGGTLRERIERERQLRIDEAVAITRALALGLAHAHGRGLIHRDVKPENILFAGDRPCLADFGIARALEPSEGETTVTGILRGTPAYMSPEQASGERTLDGRSDIYSLACVLYEMITGVTPFVGSSVRSMLAQRIQSAPTPARVHRPSITPGVEAVLERALMTFPADRYQTAQAFVDALDALPIRIGGSRKVRVPPSVPAAEARPPEPDRPRTVGRKSRSASVIASIAATILLAVALYFALYPRGTR